MSGPVDLALAVLVRWISLVALASLVGGLALRVIVLPPDAPALGRRLARWMQACTVLVLLAGGAELLLRARTMAGGDPGSTRFRDGSSLLGTPTSDRVRRSIAAVRRQDPQGGMPRSSPSASTTPSVAP
jgi:hypothetical protein